MALSLKTEDTSSNPRWLLRNEEHDDTLKCGTRFFCARNWARHLQHAKTTSKMMSLKSRHWLKTNMDSFGRLQIHLGSVQHLCWLMILWDFIIQWIGDYCNPAHAVHHQATSFCFWTLPTWPTFPSAMRLRPSKVTGQLEDAAMKLKRPCIEIVGGHSTPLHGNH